MSQKKSQLNTNEVRIDALVAEHVMECGLIKTYPDCACNICSKKYSTNIAAAWEVVENLIANRPICKDTYFGPYYWHAEEHYAGGWEVGFGNHVPYEGFSFDDKYSTKHESVCMAICIAALKTKGIEVEVGGE